MVHGSVSLWQGISPYDHYFRVPMRSYQDVAVWSMDLSPSVGVHLPTTLFQSPHVQFSGCVGMVHGSISLWQGPSPCDHCFLVFQSKEYTCSQNCTAHTTLKSKHSTRHIYLCNINSAHNTLALLTQHCTLQTEH